MPRESLNGVQTISVTAAAIAAVLVAAFALLSPSEKAASLGLTRHGEMIVAVDAGGADVVGLTGITPGTPTQVLTVSDSGVPVWRAPSASSPTTTRGDLIRRGASADERVALGTAGHVLTSDGTDPVWGALASAGVDGARPAASLALLGRVYTATDTAVRYLCESDGAGGARWVVGGRHLYEGRDTTCARLGATRSAASDVSTSAGSILSGAIVFSLAALPGGGLILVSCTETATGNGWHLRIGDDAGNRGRLASYRVGMGTPSALLTDAVAAADNALHCLAWTWDGVTVRYSWDGATVATATHTSGTMTAGSGAIRYGAISTGAFPPNADFAAVKLWSSAVGDADLEAVAAAYASGRIPDVAGSTLVFDWHAARYVEGITVQPCVRGTAQRMTWTASAPPMVIR